MDLNIPMPLRALLVEDVEDDAILIIDRLTSGGYDVEWYRVESESALLERLREHWDIIFSDHSIPGFSGTDALKIVRRQDPDVPFIFVSGTLGEDKAVEAIRAGAQDYVMKGQLARILPTVDRELRDVRLRKEKRQADQNLRKLSLVVKQAADSVIITDLEGHIEYVNPAFEKLTGYSFDEVKGKTAGFLLPDPDIGRNSDQQWRAARNDSPYKGVVRIQRKDGSLFHEEKIISPLTDDDGKITHIVSTARDISDRLQAEEAQTRLTRILEATPDLVTLFTPEYQLVYLNGASHQAFNTDTLEDIEALTLKHVLPSSLFSKLETDVIPFLLKEGVWTGEESVATETLGILSLSLVVLTHCDQDGAVKYISMIARDVSERKKFEAEIHYRKTHDPLTGLPNRIVLIERLTPVLQHAYRRKVLVAVISLDIVDFKRVNEVLGSDAGDTLLKQVAQRLSRALWQTDIIARHGVDEFTLVCEDLTDAENILVIIHKIQTAFDEHFLIGRQEVYVTLTIGIAVYPYDGKSAEELVRHADIANNQAKAAGANLYRFYAASMDARGHELLKLESELRRAIENNELCLYYQPQLRLIDNQIVGLEALIRWQHPDRGLVEPNDFIPILERTGLIIRVGEWVIFEACFLHKRLRLQGHGHLRICVNVSPAQFNDIDFSQKVERALLETGMRPDKLEFEITENTVMENPKSAAEQLLAIRALGIRTAIDDFGTGYSSLVYLKRFPLSVLKIDREFICDINSDSSNAAIVEASISLAKNLGLEVVAEGVETKIQLLFLRNKGCDLVQGYLISRPVPESSVDELLSRSWS